MEPLKRVSSPSAADGDPTRPRPRSSSVAWCWWGRQPGPTCGWRRRRSAARSSRCWPPRAAGGAGGGRAAAARRGAAGPGPAGNGGREMLRRIAPASKAVTSGDHPDREVRGGRRRGGLTPAPPTTSPSPIIPRGARAYPAAPRGQAVAGRAQAHQPAQDEFLSVASTTCKPRVHHHRYAGWLLEGGRRAGGAAARLGGAHLQRRTFSGADRRPPRPAKIERGA